MLNYLLYINWNADPTLFEIGPLVFRWYGVLFALGLLTGFQLVKKAFLVDGLNEKQIDNILYATVIGTIVGARLGHVFFYDWDYYSQNLGEIPKIWEGGLASHGGGIGIIIGIWLYSKYGIQKSTLWTLDRLTIAVAAGSIFIRLGNLMNHEIIGIPASIPWAFIFNLVDEQPRHPAQLYEAITWIITLLTMSYVYWKTDKKKLTGYLFGLFLIMAFSFRFLIEFVKNSQGGFENSIGNIISTGQLLSIPFILTGVILMVKSKSAKTIVK